MRCGLEPLQGEAVGIGAERVAVRAEPQHHVEPPLVARSRREHRGQFVDVAPGDRRSRVGGLLGQRRRDDLLVDQRGVGVVPTP